MKLNELKAELEKRERQLKNADPEQVNFLEGKIKDLKEKIKDAEKESDKAAKEAAEADMKKEKAKPEKKKPTEKKEPEPKKPAKQKFTGKAKPGDKVGKYTIVSETEGEQEVAKDLKLKKVSNDVYTLLHKDKAAFDFVKKNNRWQVECKVDSRNRKQGFSTLNGAVIYVAKSVYSSELRSYIEAKKKAAKKQAEWREKNPSGKSTPAKDQKTATAKVVEKIKEKVEDDKDVSTDINSVLRSFKTEVAELVLLSKKDKSSIDKKLVESVMKELNKLL